jgi:radical SAM superfamily enzyme YgiQ (UPF0313 family)
LLERPPAPGPELERLPIPLYDEAILSESGRPGLAILQARGCYWGRCTYCDFKESYKGSPKYRTRRVAGFVSELEAQIRMFDILTDSLPPAFARRLARELIERRLQIHWQSFVMVDRHFTRELLSLMRAAGCHKLVLGLESMTDRVLALVKKQADQQENLRFLDDARATGIRLQVNLIPNLPTVTHGEAMKTLELLRNYTDVIVDLEVSPLEVTESSELGRRPADFHLEVRPAEAGTAQNHLEFIDPAMTPEERERVIADYRAFAREIGDLRQRS